ncbi:vesicular, overexpressed in cancer, prosurvival protein 1 [Dermochelys coriacea]|uniref:vesicular, overexpressed in cancer, prosurvival protein 1 n=1 Tax=Dermochelys coriacea TaxID=27794 RepID=UPI001CA8DC50|nr:vesicular, overexpressed in cancer, prosurvival protein 1 [Dermochelys coriacea]
MRGHLSYPMTTCFAQELLVRDLVKRFLKIQVHYITLVHLFVDHSSKNSSRLCTEAKKHCWYFEGLYPTYYICRSYEDCCGSRCCVRALSIQRLWYFWFLLMMGVLFCCGAGFFIRRRMYPPPLVEEPTFNVSYTRQPANTAAGSQQPGMPYYTDPGGPVMNPMSMAFHVQPNSPPGNPVYPPPPSYCNAPPPPYEQVVKSST